MNKMNKSKLLSLSLLAACFAATSINLIGMKRQEPSDKDIINTLKAISKTFSSKKTNHTYVKKNIKSLNQLINNLPSWTNRAKDLTYLKKILEVSMECDKGNCNGGFFDGLGWLPLTKRRSVRKSMEITIKNIQEHYGLSKNSSILEDYAGVFGGRKHKRK